MRKTLMASQRVLKLGILIVIVLLATSLRWHQLDADSLWGDEIVEVLYAQKDLASILGNNPLALRSTLTHLFSRIGGHDFVIRFPYAAFGILGVILIYQVGRTLFDETTGIIAAFLLAISPFHIQYSQEARSYSLTVLLALASLYCLLRALKSNRLREWAGFAFLTALSPNNHLTAASFVASEAAYAALVLLIEKLSQLAQRQQTVITEHLASSQKRKDLVEWLRMLRSSREAMLALSLLTGTAFFLLLSGAWFSYLSRIGLSTAGSGASANDVAVLRISQTFIKRLLSDFGAGKGPVLYLYSAGFLVGLVSSAIDRQWRQLLLAPVWILPPLFILSRVSASAYFSPKHLIFILPLYLLFVARGIVGVGQLSTRYLRLSARSRKLLQGTCILLITAILAWSSGPGVQAYYSDHKEDWKGAAELIREEARSGDIVVQLQIWPTDPLRFYLEGQPGPTEVLLADLQAPEGSDFPITVWWVMLVAQPSGTPSHLAAPPELAGSEFAVYSFHSLPFKSPAVLRRQTPIADPTELLQVATKLLLVQAQSDAWSYFEGYMNRVSQTASLLEPPPLQSACPSEFLDAEKYVQAALEQSQNSQREDAIDSTLKALAIYELMYPGPGRPHESVLEALSNMGDSALESGYQECSVLFYTRAAKARLLDVEADPDAIDNWQKLAETLVKAARPEEAATAYRHLLELDPENLEYRVQLAKAYRASGQHEKGYDTLEQAVELAPTEPQLRRYLADAYFLDGKMVEAASAFQQILAITPDDIEARLGLALAYDALGQESEAIQELERLIQIDPDHWLVPEAREKLDELQQ